MLRINGHVGDLDLSGENGAIWVTNMRGGRLVLPLLTDPAETYLLRLSGCEDVACDLPTIQGTPDANGIGWQFGVLADGCARVTLRDGALADLRTGIAVTRSAGVSIEGAEIRRFADGISFADGDDYAMTGVVMRGSVSDYEAGGGRAHPDLVQMQALKAPLRGVVIRDCDLRGLSGPTQGIFAKDHGHGVTGVVIEGNTVGASLPRGISVTGCTGAVVRGNIVFAEAGADADRWPVLIADADATVAGNLIWPKKPAMPLVRGGAEGQSGLNTEMTTEQLLAAQDGTLDWPGGEPEPEPPAPEPEPEPEPEPPMPEPDLAAQVAALTARVDSLTTGLATAHSRNADLAERLARLIEDLRGVGQ